MGHARNMKFIPSRPTRMLELDKCDIFQTKVSFILNLSFIMTYNI